MSNFWKRVAFIILFGFSFMLMDYRLSHDVAFPWGIVMMAPLALWVSIVASKFWPSERSYHEYNSR